MKWIVTWDTIVHHSEGTWFEKNDRKSHSLEFDSKEDAYKHRDVISNSRFVANVKIKKEVSLNDIYDAIVKKT